MKNFELYLNSHPEVRSCVYWLDRDASLSRLSRLLRTVSLDRVTLTGPLRKNQAEALEALSGTCQVRYLPPDRLEGPVEALVFENVRDVRELFGLAALKPRYLAGEMPRQAVSSFSLWEAFRKVTDHIHITTLRGDREPQVLQWDRREDTDIDLSVIFPMYNVAAYLDQCIASVTAWKAEYVEFLFVNDGSPDDSREVVLRWAQKDPRIRLLDKPNGGCASARQWGLDRARGRYIGFIDPDDFTEESMFRKLLRAAMEGSYEISYAGYREYYEDSGKTCCVDDLTGPPYCDGVTDSDQIHSLAAFCRVAIWRGIYSRELLDRGNIRFYTELRRFDDLPFKFETFAHARSVVAVDEHLYYYRLARPGQDVSADDDRLYVHFPIFRHLNESIAAGQDPRLIDYLQICKIQTHRYAISKIRKEFLKEYVRQARADLKTTGTFLRTLRLARSAVGRVGCLYYLGIMTGNLPLLKRLPG